MEVFYPPLFEEMPPEPPIYRWLKEQPNEWAHEALVEIDVRLEAGQTLAAATRKALKPMQEMLIGTGLLWSARISYPSRPRRFAHRVISYCEHSEVAYENPTYEAAGKCRACGGWAAFEDPNPTVHYACGKRMTDDFKANEWMLVEPPFTSEKIVAAFQDPRMHVCRHCLASIKEIQNDR